MITLNKLNSVIKIARLAPYAILPEKDGINDVGYLIRASRCHTLKRYRTTEIPLDLVIQIPYGYYGTIHDIPRHAKNDIFITYGLVLPMMHFGVKILMKSTSLENSDYIIDQGDPIGILILHKMIDLPIVREEVENIQQCPPTLLRAKDKEVVHEYRVYMNFTTEEAVNSSLQDSVGEQFTISDEEVERLKEAIPHPHRNEIYKPPTLTSRFLNKHAYVYERMQGNIELRGGDDFHSIKLLDAQKIEKLKRKYPKMRYLHIGLIQIKITALFRAGIDTPIMVVCFDERIVNNPLNAILGGTKSNLANRLFAININPDFCVSLDDKNIEKACTFSINLKGIEMLTGSRVLGIEWEHFMALNDTPTFRSITPKEFVQVYEVGTGKTIRPRLVDLRHLRIDNDMQIFVNSLKPQIELPEEYFIASGNVISTVRRNHPGTQAGPSTPSLQRSNSVEEEKPEIPEIGPRPSFRYDALPMEGRTKKILDSQEKAETSLVKAPTHKLQL